MGSPADHPTVHPVVHPVVRWPVVVIRKRTTARGEVRYDVKLRRPDRSTYGRTFRTRKAAEAWEREQLAKRDRGEWIDPSAGRALVEHVAGEWLAQPGRRAKTVTEYRRKLDRWVLPELGQMPVAAVTPGRPAAGREEPPNRTPRPDEGQPGRGNRSQRVAGTPDTTSAPGEPRCLGAPPRASGRSSSLWTRTATMLRRIDCGAMTSSAATRATLIAARLREHRKCSGLSQQEAAARVGVTQGTWSRWESGKHAPKAEHLGPVAALLGCPVTDLIPSAVYDA